MNNLLSHYTENIKASDEFEAFNKFFSGNIKPIEEYYRNLSVKTRFAKNNPKSQDLRQVGNNFFKKGSYQKCVKYYTRALNYAKFDSKEYALALANRSAALYSLEDYKNCLKDIDRCTNSKYPKELAHKIYMRKAECCNKLGTLTEDVLKTIEKFILEAEFPAADKENHIRKLKNMKIQDAAKTVKENEDVIDNLGHNFKENPDFAYASGAIMLCYDKNTARSVKAKRKISEGETLFIEKAFIFAPVFDDTAHIVPNKCFNCLTDTTITIPCKTCSICLYCSEICRETSWNEFHQWECKGMTYNLFYDLGIAYPALRALVKGIPTKFADVASKRNVDKFGSKVDNYPYFNSLVSNLDASPHYVHFLIMSTLLVLYLKKDTSLLNHIKEVLSLESDNLVMIKCGGYLIRHMAQLSCNSSVIEHWNITPDKIPTQSTAVACAIYPSISMMNHSCKTNIAISYHKDISIVKALRDIDPNEEIFNCYGVDYRYMKFNERQEHLRRLYNFICKCEICSNPLLEFELLDTYLCPKCQGPLGTIVGNCYSCKQFSKLENMKQTEAVIDAILDKTNHSKADIDKCYDLCTKIFSKNHIKLAECLDAYVNLFKDEQNYLEMFSYFKKSLQVKNARYGCNARNLIMHRIDTSKEIMDKLNAKEMNKDEVVLYQKVKDMYDKAFSVLKLYFTDDIIKLYSGDVSANK